MKYLDFKFFSHIFAILLAFAYAWSGNSDGHIINYTVLSTKYSIEGFWAVFSTYMLIWCLLGGVIEFFVDLTRPIAKYVKG